MYNFNTFKEIQIIQESLKIENFMMISEAADPNPSTPKSGSNISDLLKGSDLFKELSKNKAIAAIMTMADKGRAETEIKKFAKDYKNVVFGAIKMENKINIEKEKIDASIDKIRSSDNPNESQIEQLENKKKKLDAIQETNKNKIEKEKTIVGMKEKELDVLISKLQGSTKDKIQTEKRQTKLAIDIALQKYLQKLADDKLNREHAWDDDQMKKNLANMDDIEKSLSDADDDYEKAQQEAEAAVGDLKDVITEYIDKSATILDCIQEWENTKKPDPKDEYTDNPNIDDTDIIKKLKYYLSYYKEIVSACTGASPEQRKEWKKDVNKICNDKNIKLDDDVEANKENELMDKLNPQDKYVKKQTPQQGGNPPQQGDH